MFEVVLINNLTKPCCNEQQEREILSVFQFDTSDEAWEFWDKYNKKFLGCAQLGECLLPPVEKVDN